MTEMPAVSIVIAVRDEADVIGEVIERTARTLGARGDTFEILVVDDGSSDGTGMVVRDLARRHAQLGLLEFAGPHGQANALACGLFAARGSVVVTLDGDLQDPPEEIAALLDGLADAFSVASGCRRVRHESRWRWLASRGVHHLACWCCRQRLRDFGGNFRAYRRDVVEAMRQAWIADTPLLPLALARGAEVVEIDVRRDRRRAGATRYDLPSLLHIVHALVSTFPGAALQLSLLPAVALALWAPHPALAASVVGLAAAYEGIAWIDRRRRAAISCCRRKTPMVVYPA